VLNLEETDVGAIILGDYTGIKEGQEVQTTGRFSRFRLAWKCWGAW
jgi:F-type H+-transporting ATPase subunit alpha